VPTWGVTFHVCLAQKCLTLTHVGKPRESLYLPPSWKGWAIYTFSIGINTEAHLLTLQGWKVSPTFTLHVLLVIEHHSSVLYTVMYVCTLEM